LAAVLGGLPRSSALFGYCRTPLLGICFGFRPLTVKGETRIGGPVAPANKDVRQTKQEKCAAAKANYAGVETQGKALVKMKLKELGTLCRRSNPRPI
jgi:hypothetical protein